MLADKLKNIMKTIKSPEDSGLLFKEFSEIIQNWAKEKKEDLLLCYQVHKARVY